MTFATMDRPPVPGQNGSAWSRPFKSRLVFFFALGFSSAGSLAKYVPGALPTKMLFAGVFFGLALAGFAYVLFNLRNLQGPLNRREGMILAPVIGLVVAMLAMRCFLLFHGG